MIASLWLRIQGAALTAGAVLLVLLGIYAMGGRAARKSVELNMQKRNVQAAKDRRDVEEEIRVLPDADVDKRLHEWNRD